MLGADTRSPRGPDPLLRSLPLPPGLSWCPQIPLPLVQLRQGWSFPVEMLPQEESESAKRDYRVTLQIFMLTSILSKVGFVILIKPVFEFLLSPWG